MKERLTLEYQDKNNLKVIIVYPRGAGGNEALPDLIKAGSNSARLEWIKERER
jgi:hypothetical protein